MDNTDRDLGTPAPRDPSPTPPRDPTDTTVREALAAAESEHHARVASGAPCTCDTIAAEDCRGGLRGCEHPRPAPGYEPRPRLDAPGGAE